MAITDEVKISATADTNAALSALQGIDASLQRLSTTAEKTNQKTESMFDGLSKAGTAAVGILGVGSALQIASTAMSLFNAEWDNYIAKQKAATDAQLNYADASRRMANQLHDFSYDQANKRVMAISQKTGVPAARMALAMEGILGSMGAGQSDELAFSAGEAAAKFRPGAMTSADEAGAYGQGIVEIRKAFPNYSSEQAAAAMSHMMRLDRSETAFAFTRNVLPGILARKTSDKDTLESLATLPITIGQLSGDRTGRSSRTASVGMDKQLDEAVVSKTGRTMSKDERDRYLLTTPGGEEIRKRLLGPYWGAGFNADQIDEMSPEFQALAERMTGSKVRFHGEAKQFSSMIQLLDNNPTNNAKKVWAATQRDIGNLGSPELIRDFDAREAAINRSPLQDAAISTRAVTAATEQMALGNEKAGVDRGEFQKLLQQAGVPNIAQRAILSRYDARRVIGKGRSDTIQAEIEAAQSGIQQGTPIFTGGPMGPQGVINQPPNEEQKRTNELLEEVIRKLSNQKVQLDLGDGPTERGQMGQAQRAGQN